MATRAALRPSGVLQELAAYVATTDYTFGYIVLGYALDTGASVVWVRSVSGKNIIEPSIDAVQFAVAELGLSFGNTGESADRLTADVEGAQVRRRQGTAILTSLSTPLYPSALNSPPSILTTGYFRLAGRRLHLPRDAQGHGRV